MNEYFSYSYTNKRHKQYVYSVNSQTYSTHHHIISWWNVSNNSHLNAAILYFYLEISLYEYQKVHSHLCRGSQGFGIRWCGGWRNRSWSFCWSHLCGCLKKSQLNCRFRLGHQFPYYVYQYSFSLDPQFTTTLNF